MLADPDRPWADDRQWNLLLWDVKGQLSADEQRRLLVALCDRARRPDACHRPASQMISVFLSLGRWGMDVEPGEREMVIAAGLDYTANPKSPADSSWQTILDHFDAYRHLSAEQVTRRALRLASTGPISTGPMW